MSGPSRREIGEILDRLESGGDHVDRTHIPPAQAKRLERAFELVEEPIDPERVADLFVYGEGAEEITDDEASAMRTVEWREKFDEEPPWSDGER